MDNWQYAAKLPTSPWRGQMTVPRKLALRRTSDGIRLFQLPVDSLDRLRTTKVIASGADIAAVNQKLHAADLTQQRTFEFAAAIDPGSAQEVGWRILHQDGTATVVGYDRSKRTLFIDRTHSGDVSFSPDFPSRMDARLQIDRSLNVQVLVDRSSVEVFADGGRVAMTSLDFPLDGASGIEAYANGGTPANLAVTLWALNSTHE
jgi:sucrose-6-phosphate hydrolase SacC (GH32 family)